MVTERTIILPPNPDGGGQEAQYKLTVMVPKRRFLTYLLNRWWVVPACLVLTIGFILTYETLREGKYVSSAVLYVSGEVQLTPYSLVNEESLQFLGTQIELLKSWRMQAAAYDEVGIKLVPEKDPPITVDVSQPMKTSFLHLRAKGPDPAATKRFLQALIDGYLAYKKATHLSTAEEVYYSVTEQVSKKASELQVEQDKWAEFQQTNNVAVIEEEAKSAGLYLADLNLQLAKLKLEKNLLQEGLSLNPATDGWAAPFLPEPRTNSSSSSFGPHDLMLKSAKVELAVRRAERDEIVQQRGETAARRLNDEVSHLEKTVAVLEAQNLEQKRLEVEETEKRIAAMETAIPAWEAKVLNINERLSKNLQYKNNVLREQGFYDHMLGTLGNVDLNKNVQQERLSVLQPASSALPEKRYLPLRIALAVAIGLMLSFGIVFIWQLLDDRLVSVADVTDHFGKMVLGVVPRIRVPRREPQAALLAPEDGRRTYLESFRRLRSALLLSSFAEGQPRTLLFTSAAHREGKTTVAVNLAMVLARSGLKVVLVDADSQSRTAHPLLDSADKPGLMEYLQGRNRVPEIVHSTEVPGLSFVPIGAIPERADGLFLGGKLGELILNLRSGWEYVILDSPPVLTSDDTALMIPQADAVLLVVRPFSTRSRMVRHAMEMLYQRQARQVTMVLNEARRDDVAAQFGFNGTAVQNGSTKDKSLRHKPKKDSTTQPPVAQ